MKSLFLGLGLACASINSANSVTVSTSILPSISNSRVSENRSPATTSDEILQVVSESSFTGGSTGNQLSLDAKARASFGNVGVMASTSQVSGGSSASVFVDVFAGFEDQLFFGIDTGFVDLTVDLTGSLSAPTPFVLESVDFIVSGLSGATRTGGTIYHRSQDGAGPGPTGEQVFFIEEEGSLGESIVRLAFTNGMLDLAVGLQSVSRCRVVQSSGDCASEVSFFNSAHFLGASVFDIDGMQINGASITSGSGFDYVAGIDRSSVVPLPATFPLLLTAFVALFGVRLLREHRTGRLKDRSSLLAQCT